jgi:hypothetical protein
MSAETEAGWPGESQPPVLNDGFEVRRSTGKNLANE